MSVEKAFRDLVRDEITAQLRPVMETMRRLEASNQSLNSLHAMAQRLQPLLGAFGTAPVPAPARRGRPPKATSASSSAVATRAPTPTLGRPRGRPALSGGKACAIIGCKRPARSKGYCAAHYQKLRLLIQTQRRPNAWVDNASAQSVPDLVLPRGRAASDKRGDSAPGSNG